ncbi:MAG TPA: hypothetical protein VK177_13125 [Flavobacteriales bacterium]|nr:hypothetical protein [Flavobacteriales bacterium]
MKTHFFFFFCILLFSCASAEEKSTPEKEKPAKVVASNTTDSIKTIAPEKLSGFERYADSLNSMGDSVHIDVFEMSWQSDDALCDSYEGSDGPLTYYAYRLTSSEKIIFITEAGSYCQGDSEFDNTTLYDLQGNYVMSTHFGMYQPRTTTFYESGIPVARLEEQGEGEEAYSPRLLRETTNHVYSLKDEGEPGRVLQERMHKRRNGLEKLQKTLTDQRDKDEAAKTLEMLSEILMTQENWEWKTRCVLRKARKTESTMVSRFEVPVHADANQTSKAIDKISYYDKYLTVDEISADGNWYKLSGTYTFSGQKVQGWVEKKYLVPGIFDAK